MDSKKTATTPSRAMRVLITGATGLVGGRLCEVMVGTGSFTPRAFIHTTGGAWRIARFPLDFFRGDLRDAKSVSAAVEGCDAVVHLARGDKAVMTQGLENVLRASVRCQVSRLLHVSSVAVYGNNPPPESVSEEAPAHPTGSEYGDEKLAQEKLVRKYGRSHGLPFVILRPPNIYGPYSSYSLDTFEKVRDGRLPVVDGGKNPCSLVFIDNLIEAIILSLWKPEAVGETFFVTDSDVVTWAEWLREHAALAGVDLVQVSSSSLEKVTIQRLFADSLRALPSVLLGGELRRALRQIALIQKVEGVMYDRFLRLNEKTKQSMRLRVNGPITFPPNGSDAANFSLADGMISSQARCVAHSSEKARRLLGYSSPVSHREAMLLTESWLRFARAL